MWADGGRRKWWRKWRCPIVCVRTLCNGLLPCGSGGCKSDGKSGCCKSGGKSGESGGKSGGKSGKSGGCKSCKRSDLFSCCLCALHVVQWPPALQGRYTRPPFNGAAAVKRLSASVSGGVFLRGSKQEQKYFRIAILVITYFYISAADTGLELVERGSVKVLHFNYSKFLLSQLRNSALFSKR